MSKEIKVSRAISNYGFDNLSQFNGNNFTFVKKDYVYVEENQDEIMISHEGTIIHRIIK